MAPPRRARWSSSGTRCPASGSSPRSPRCTAATCAPTRSRCSSPRRTGSSRPARTPGRAAAAAATCSTSRRPRSATGRRRRARAARPAGRVHRRGDRRPGRTGGRAAGRAGPARLALPGALRGRRRRPGRAAQAPVARGRADRPVPDRPPGDPGAAGARPSGWPGAEAVETVASSAGDVVGPRAARPTSPRRSSARWPSVGRGRSPSDAFWQVHPAAADTLADAVLDLVEPRAGEGAWDLYGGAGLFAAALGRRVGPGGRVTLVESAPAGVAAARDNLRDLPWVEVVAARVEVALAKRRVAGPVDVVVLDPPRTGAGPRVVRTLAALGRPGGRVRRLRPGRLRPRRAHVPRAGLAAGRAARLRLLPDDPARRVRRPAPAGGTRSPDRVTAAGGQADVLRHCPHWTDRRHGDCRPVRGAARVTRRSRSRRRVQPMPAGSREQRHAMTGTTISAITCARTRTFRKRR